MMRRVTAVTLSTATYSATAATSVDCSLRFRGTRPLATRFTSPSCEGEGEKKWGVANPLTWAEMPTCPTHAGYAVGVMCHCRARVVDSPPLAGPVSPCVATSCLSPSDLL